MHLIPIPRGGHVQLACAILPEVAQSVIVSALQMYERRGYVAPWIGYLAVEGDKCVGTCGLTSLPAGGVVEIAYFTFPHFEQRGMATRMAQRLISIAQASDPSVTIIAHTLTEENASTRVLRRVGFVFTGPIDHPEDGNIWRWSYGQKCNSA